MLITNAILGVLSIVLIVSSLILLTHASAKKAQLRTGEALETQGNNTKLERVLQKYPHPGVRLLVYEYVDWFGIKWQFLEGVAWLLLFAGSITMNIAFGVTLFQTLSVCLNFLLH